MRIRLWFARALMSSAGALLTANLASGQSPSIPADSLKGQLLALGRPLGTEQGISALVALTSLEVSTAPLGTSTGGFTFTFDPRLRTWTRSASSFGPAFSERSLTTGRAKVSAGFNVLHANYDSFGDANLKNGDLQPVRNLQSPLTPISYTTLKLNLISDTVVAFGHAGVTDDLDIGVAIPWVRVKMDAEGSFFNAAGADLGQHLLVPSTTSAGVGDIAIFGKYRLWRQADGGLAAAIEARLPTGDRDALRGLDVTRTLVSLIWSKGGRVSPHANAGYEFWSDGVLIASDGSVSAKNQAKYAFGVEIEAHARATLVVDVVGRRVLNGGQVGYRALATTGGSAGSAEGLVGLPEGINQIALAPGGKWNVWRSILLTANVLAPLTTEGVRARIIPVFGVDWAF
jgi:hypothetical protein